MNPFIHGIIAIRTPGAVPNRDPVATFDDLEIYHYCGYADPPTQIDFDALYEELKNDPEFNFDFDFDLVPAPQPVAEYFSKELNYFVATEYLIEQAARTVLRLQGEEHDDYVSRLRDGKESPRENGRWRVATDTARVVIDLMKEVDPDVRHKKRGMTYAVLGDLEVQTSAPIHEGDIVTGYRCCETGKWWVRPVGEFNDGRFEQIGAKSE